MKKFIPTFLFILSLPHFSTAQNKDVEKVSITTINNIQTEIWIQVPENTNSYFHQLNTVRWDFLEKQYIPDAIIGPLDIKGFKLENNVVYVAKEITYQNEFRFVFLEEVLKETDFAVYAYRPDINIYVPEVLYMQENNKQLVPIDSECEPYKSYLKKKAFTENKSISQDLDLIKPERYSIKNAYKTYKFDKSVYLKKRIQIGIIAGLNYANSIVHINDFKKRTNNVRPLIGIFADIPFSYKEFSCHAELFYMQKKYDYRYNGFETVVRESSLALPIKIRYTNLNNTSDKIKPYIEAGLLTTFVLKHTDDLNLSYNKEYYDEKGLPYPVFGKDVPNSVYLGTIVGIGIEAAFIKKHPMHIGLNYIYTNSSKIKTHNLIASVSLTVF